MTKQELMTRYAKAKFDLSLARTNDDRTAGLHVQYALMDILSTFNATARNVSEKEALEVLEMDVEDIEAMVKNLRNNPDKE